MLMFAPTGNKNVHQEVNANQLANNETLLRQHATGAFKSFTSLCRVANTLSLYMVSFSDSSSW